MVVALDRWLRDSVQPAAREAFSSSVSQIIGSSYACRNIYNRPYGQLSQHAFANAIDVPTFVLADGRKVDLTHGWGPTQRDIAAAKAKKTAPTTTGSVVPQKANTKDETTEVTKVSTAAASVPASPSKASAKDSDVSAGAKFLRLAHDGGCRIFSTVLGPEAIAIICIWTFKSERRRFANSCA